jgi:hypothetical protein
MSEKKAEVRPRALSRFWLAAPALLCLGLVIRPLPAKEPFADFHDPELDARIDAYVPLVNRIVSARQDGDLSGAEAEDIASDWSEAAGQGDLKALRPLMLGDSLYDGATGQVLKSQQVLVNRLYTSAQEDLEAGETRRGLRRIFFAFDVMRPTTYSDSLTLTLQSIQMRRGLQTLIDWKGRLPDEDRKWMLARAENYHVDGRSIAKLASDTRRLAQAYQLRYKRGDLLGELPQEDLEILRTSTPLTSETIAHVRSEIEQVRDGVEMPPIAGLISKGLSSSLATERKLERLLQPDSED